MMLIKGKLKYDYELYFYKTQVIAMGADLGDSLACDILTCEV